VFKLPSFLFGLKFKLALLAALTLGLYAGYSYLKSSLFKQGYDKAVAEQAEADNTFLREYLREHTRLTAKVETLQDDYAKQTNDLEAFRDKLRAADSQLRNERAKLEARIAAASADSLRKYAKVADDNFERCVGHVERFAAEAVGGAAAAHALKSNLDLLKAGSPD